MSTAGGIVIAVVVILVAAAVGWVVFTQLRARRLGVSIDYYYYPASYSIPLPNPPRAEHPTLTLLTQLPPPTLSEYLPWKRSENTSYSAPRPAPGGVVGWFNDQMRKFKNRNSRSAPGAYEQPLQGGAQRRGFGPLDPDEAWDARVGVEADTYGAYYEERGRAGGRGGDIEYGGSGGNYNLAGPYGRDDEEIERGRKPSRDGGRNPFDDDAEASLRGVSPRPMDGAGGGRPRDSVDTRRSAFREEV